MNSTTAKMSTAKVTVRARDKAGNVATAKRTIMLVKWERPGRRGCLSERRAASTAPLVTGCGKGRPPSKPPAVGVGGPGFFSDGVPAHCAPLRRAKTPVRTLAPVETATVHAPIALGSTDRAITDEIGAAVRSYRTRTKPTRRDPRP
jgi:hypothetical protein